MRTTIGTIWCDGCDTHEDFSLNEYSFRSYMTANGWKMKGGKDFCPDCNKKLVMKFKKLMGLDVPEEVMDFLLSKK